MYSQSFGIHQYCIATHTQSQTRERQRISVNRRENSLTHTQARASSNVTHSTDTVFYSIYVTWLQTARDFTVTIFIDLPMKNCTFITERTQFTITFIYCRANGMQLIIFSAMKSRKLLNLLTRFIASSFSPSAIFSVLLKCSSSVKLGLLNDAVVDSSGEDSQFEFVMELMFVFSCAVRVRVSFDGVYFVFGNCANGTTNGRKSKFV